jgi:transposase
MAQLLKQVIAIEIASEKFDALYGRINSEQSIFLDSSKAFNNTKSGFHELIRWIKKQQPDPFVPLWIAMEATGVYYEQLAHFLHEHHFQITVVLPNKIKGYGSSLQNKSKTDPLDAITIARFALERKLDKWEVPEESMRRLKSLCRQRQQIIDQRTQVKNQLHALNASYKPVKTVIDLLEQQVVLFNSQIKLIETELKRLVDKDDKLKLKVKQISTIQGVGWLTVVTIIAETNGFALMESQKQLVSYAGFDIVFRDSGKKTGKTRISKKGNSHIRKALYLPAVTASRMNKKLIPLYERLKNQRTVKMIGIIAVARKLLILIYALWKNNTIFNPDYNHKDLIMS